MPTHHEACHGVDKRQQAWARCCKQTGLKPIPSGFEAHTCAWALRVQQTPFPSHPYVVLRDTLCTCEAYGMRPTCMVKTPLNTYRMPAPKAGHYLPVGTLALMWAHSPHSPRAHAATGHGRPPLHHLPHWKRTRCRTLPQSTWQDDGRGTGRGGAASEQGIETERPQQTCKPCATGACV